MFKFKFLFSNNILILKTTRPLFPLSNLVKKLLCYFRLGIWNLQRIDFKVQSFPIKWPLLAVVEDDQEKTSLKPLFICIASNYHCDEQLLLLLFCCFEKVTRRDIETKESTNRDRLKKKKKVEEGQFLFHVFHRHLL